MSHLSEALQRSGYLAPLQQGIKRILQKNKDEENQKQYNDLMQTAMDSLRETMNNKTIAAPTTRLGDQLTAPPPVTDMGTKPKMNLDLKVPDQNDSRSFIDMFPGVDINNQPTKKEFTPDQQRMKQDQVLADFMMKAQNIKGLDQEKLKQGIETLRMQKTAMTPEQKKLKFEQWDPEKDVTQMDEQGNWKIIRPGVKKAEPFKDIGSYTGNDGYQYVRLLDPKTNTIKEIKSDNKVKPPKGTVIHIDRGSGWQDAGGNINSIYYKEDPNTGMIVPTTPQEQKVMRDIAITNAKTSMFAKTPRALNWIQTEIKGKWNAENISQADFEAEIQESYNAGELTREEAQQLINFNQYRPQLYDVLRESAKANQGAE